MATLKDISFIKKFSALFFLFNLVYFSILKYDSWDELDFENLLIFVSTFILLIIHFSKK